MPRHKRMPLCLRGFVVGAAAVSVIAVAGCSHSSASQHPTPPPASTVQAINNAAPPPLNLPANMPQDQKDQLLAQQQRDVANAKAAQQRLFAAAGMKMPPGSH